MQVSQFRLFLKLHNVLVNL